VTRFCVNVGFLFTELPFLERFAAVRGAGFDAVEFAWPAAGWDDLAAALRDAGVHVAQMNMDAGDLAAGERGWASHPDAVGRWQTAFEAALELCGRLECPAVNVLAGNAPAGALREMLEGCLRENLHWALPRAAASGRTLLLEVLNSRDTPAYLFTDLSSAAAFVSSMENPALRIQFDTYHVATGGDDPAVRLRELSRIVGHVQVADAPGRHEPGSGAIDFRAFFRALAAIGYGGAVGLEYVPATRTLAGLGWLPPVARRSSEQAWLPREA